jgi:hypothetical protein
MEKNNFEVKLSELSRILSNQGHALIGCSSATWDNEKIFDQLQILNDEGFIDLLMIQKLGIHPPIEDDYTMCLFRALA